MARLVHRPDIARVQMPLDPRLPFLRRRRRPLQRRQRRRGYEGEEAGGRGVVGDAGVGQCVRGEDEGAGPFPCAERGVGATAHGDGGEGLTVAVVWRLTPPDRHRFFFLLFSTVGVLLLFPWFGGWCGAAVCLQGQRAPAVDPGPADVGDAEAVGKMCLCVCG